MSWYAVLLLFLAALGFVFLGQDSDAMRGGAGPALAEAAAWGAAGTLTAAAGTYLSLRAGARAGRALRWALLASLAGSVLWTALHAAYGHLAGRLLPAVALLETALALLGVLAFQAITLYAWQALQLAFRFRETASAAREAALRAEGVARENELRMLRYQLDPHFLFNSLNTMAALVDESPARARAAIEALSALLRRTLESDRPLVPLGEEMETLHAYVLLLEARLEDKIFVSFQVEEDASLVPVPPLLLQPLLENAVRHGLRTAPPPVVVTLQAIVASGRLWLRIENDGRLGDARAAGVGIENTRRRLENVYREDFTFSLTEIRGKVVAALGLPSARPKP